LNPRNIAVGGAQSEPGPPHIGVEWGAWMAAGSKGSMDALWFCGISARLLECLGWILMFGPPMDNSYFLFIDGLLVYILVFDSLALFK
jgi:hypothetical protein